MGNRLSKIYTRTGDDGTTGMADGSRISKSEHIFEVMGDIDELNSHIGMVRAFLTDHKATTMLDSPTSQGSQIASNDKLKKSLSIIQHLLFNLGGELAMLGSDCDYQGVEDKHISWLEKQIDEMNTQLTPLKDFILPAGTSLMCQLHIARSVCRRAERHAIRLNTEDSSYQNQLNKTAIQFLNRLSDWLFVTARFVAFIDHNQTKQHQTQLKTSNADKDTTAITEVLWDKEVLHDLQY